MRSQTYLYFTLILFGLSSCVISQNKRIKQDDRKVHFLDENKDKLKEAVAFALDYTWGTKTREFEVKSVSNGKKRRLLSNFGFRVIVNYHQGNEDSDSAVIFKTINFSGVHEVVYYFSLNPSQRGDYTEREYAVRKVSDNIYYCRRPFPFM